MRPLTLELSGFRSHSRHSQIDFSQRNLIAIVGPTGAGKSSILDGISYALYGKTPRLRTGIKRLICTRCEEARVRLEFSVDGALYRVTRALPRKGSGEHLLEAVDSGQKYIGAEEVAKRVEELLGLDFEAFCSSVLLAQGRFSEFLDAAPTRRAGILKGAFRLEQIDDLKDAAKRGVAELRLKLAEIEGARREIPDDVEAQRRTAVKEAKAVAKTVVAYDKAVPVEKKLLAALEKSTQELERLARDVARLESVIERVPAPEELERLAEEEERVDVQVKAASAALGECSSQEEASLAHLEEVEQKVGTEEALVEARAAARSLLETAREIATLDESIVTQREELEDHREALVEAGAGEGRAGHDLAKLREEKSALEQQHRAHVLRGELVAGEACPVCEQPVVTLPRRRAPTALASVDKDIAKAEASLEKARRETALRQSALDKADSKLEAAEQQLGAARERFLVLDERVKATVGATADPVAAIEQRLATLQEGRRELDEVRKRQRAAQKQLDEANRLAARFQMTVRQSAGVLIEIAGRTDLEGPSVDARAADLADFAATARDTMQETHRAALQSFELVEEKAAGTQADLAALRRSLELGEEDGVEEARSDAKAQLKVIDKDIDILEAACRRAAELDQEQQTLSKRRALFDQLAEDLRNDRFVSFLMEERRHLLSELGSVRLREMTGRYRFDDDGNFKVVDELDGDKVRDSGTLSGGETFLASLALALALAEAVARHGGRLQCFFLDEGFDALDAESLDLALDAIETIVDRDRLIGLVSHVPALAERVEDKIELEKDADGMTVLKAGALG